MSDTTTKATLILICGLPGAGKTTLAKKLAQERSAIRFCPDEWMQVLEVSLWNRAFRNQLENRLWELGQELLQLGQTVILEYGFWGRSERDEKLHDARALGVSAELHYLDVPNDELRRRLEKRGMEGDDVILAGGKLEEWSERFERPDEAELRLYDTHVHDETVTP